MVDITFQRREQRSPLPWLIAAIVVIALIWLLAGRSRSPAHRPGSFNTASPGEVATPPSGNGASPAPAPSTPPAASPTPAR